MKTLAILSRKGGTGKTTVCTHLAVAASQAQKSVRVLDLDPQRSALDWRRERSARLKAPEVREGRPGALFTAVRMAERDNVGLLMIDTRAGGEDDMCEAVRVADFCLLVVRPSFFDARSIARSVEAVENIGKDAMFVVNQAPVRQPGAQSKAVKEAMQHLAGYGLPIAPVSLRMRSAYQNATIQGLTAQEIAPDGRAALEINSLWQDLSRRIWSSHSSVDPAADPAPQARRQLLVSRY